MTVGVKITTINKKIEQNKAKYDKDRQTAKIQTVLSGSVGKYEFSTGEYVLPEKELLEKASTINFFEYLPLFIFSKKYNDIA